MSKVESVVAMYKQGFVCSQAMLSTYGTKFGLDREIALKVAAAFGGGMSRMGKTCGAVTGAFMLIGLKHGNITPKDKQARRKTYELVREFVSKFESRHGSIKCQDLLGCDISTPEGWNAAKNNKLFETVCPKYVRHAAEIIEQILA
ncbi:MAG: C_GCAxxG_C_C family protein [Desulfobacterales bacterium]|nr:MAG: C_GCAxxG_C_C family protein [Desulfobacterales bacterium]UCG80356.1 MAG: C_GCAxxG_C_C family protein [Desulfobacterales bacterium]